MNTSLSAGEKLGDVLRNSGWHGIIGTWVDAETNGELVKATYEWRLQDHVIATSTYRAGTHSAALIGINAKSGEIFHVGGDDAGGCFLGEWDLDEPRKAMLSLGMTEPDGEQSKLAVQYELVDQDTMTVTIMLPLPITYDLVRAANANGSDSRGAR